MTDQTNDPMAEIAAMKTVAEALAQLDAESARRVLAWAADRFGIAFGGRSVSRSEEEGPGGEEASDQAYSDIADLYAAAEPKSDPDRVLVAAYWYQFYEGLGEFDAQRINTALKHMGHGVKNVTSAFTSLKARKPALVMQTKKSGSTQQARKRYKLTTAGKQAVEGLLRKE